MKRTLLIGVCMVFCASMAFAQNGSIAVFSDLGGSECGFTDAGSLVTVYVFHVNSPGATASEWKLDVSETGWVHLGDTADFDLVIGTSINGASISYESCWTGTFKLMNVNFFGTSAPACTRFGVVAAPGKSGVQAIDCAEGRVFPSGGEGIVNPDGTCQCNVPVEEATWSKIKSLYN